MEYITLGKTGLKVSVAGLGCGGPSRLGMRNDPQSANHAIALLKQGLDLGINFLDTAQTYGTESVVGRAIAGLQRDQLVISTKKTLPSEDDPDPETQVSKGLEQSLKFLGTDYIDIYHLHGVEPKDYGFVKKRLLPVMSRLKEEGKIRFIGVTEGFVPDPSHHMLQSSLDEDVWDVVMVGFSMLNPSARKTILPLTMENGVGVLNMFAVRRALSQPQRLQQLCAELIASKTISTDGIDPSDPLGFVLQMSDAASFPEAAYRFCRHEPGIHVVLTGTGNPEHLRENVTAILKPPLPQPVLRKLDDLFGRLDSLTGN
jgi:aryl-alcohol dehydrogenase-like predicted oxidoreductase